MKKVTEFAAQGDVMFVRVSDLPVDAVPFSGSAEDARVIAHSETGHHHTVDGDGVARFEYRDPMTCYLRCDAEHMDIVHHRPHDTHETLRLLGEPGAVWMVRRQREYTPQGWRRVED